MILKEGKNHISATKDKLEAVRSFLTTSLKLVLKNIYQAAVLFWTKGMLLKGKKLIYSVRKKESQCGMV